MNLYTSMKYCYLVSGLMKDYVAQEQTKAYRIFDYEFMPHIDALKTFAYHLCYDDTYANDLVQEIYLKAFRFLDKNDEGTNMKAIEAISPNILRLKLSDLNVGDEHLIQIAQMKHITKLYLDNTAITDEGLSLLKEHQYLNYLNVNNTDISNKGIESLNEVKSLRSVFAYQTNVAHELLQSDLNIETGNYKLEFYPHDTIRIPQS